MKAVKRYIRYEEAIWGMFCNAPALVGRHFQHGLSTNGHSVTHDVCSKPSR